MRQELRIDRILADMPHLIDGMIEGAERTRDIVDALKRFSAVDRGDARAGRSERGGRALGTLGGAERLGRSSPCDVDLPADLLVLRLVRASCSRW